MTFTFVADFRGGTYCSQVEANNIETAMTEWIEKLKSEKDEIKYLGDKVLDQIQIAVQEEYNSPIRLKGLKNIWFTCLTTSQGAFHINIIQTDIN